MHFKLLTNQISQLHFGLRDLPPAFDRNIIKVCLKKKLDFFIFQIENGRFF